MTDVEQNRTTSNNVFYPPKNVLLPAFAYYDKPSRTQSDYDKNKFCVRDFTALQKLPICSPNFRHLPDSETSSVPTATAACPFPVTDY